MRRFVEGVDRGQNTLFPECLEDWIGEENPVRVIDVFVDELDLAELGPVGVARARTHKSGSANRSLMSASLRNRPNCCDTAKCREGPESDITHARVTCT